MVVAPLAQLTRTGAVAPASAGTVAAGRSFPLLPVFSSLLPTAAVQRGSVVACRGHAAMGLAAAVVAGPCAAGSWVAVAGLPSLGLSAMAEAGVPLQRLVAVAEPAGAPFTESQWGDLLAAMVDGFEVVMVGPGAQRVRAATARRLVARAQSKGVLVVAVDNVAFGADLVLQGTRARWCGVGQGHGIARRRLLDVEVSGRRMPRPGRAQWWLPGPDGGVHLADPADAIGAADTVGVSGAPVVSPTEGQQVVVPLRRTG